MSGIKSVLSLLFFFIGILVQSGSASTIELPSASGNRIRPLDLQGQKAGVYFFIAHDCPIANSYAPEINRIVKRYAAKKISFYIVYSEIDTPVSELKAHSKSYGYSCPSLFDKKHELVNKVHASVTPEVVILSPEGVNIYRGRIDDRYLDFGKMKQEASVHDLRDALDFVCKGLLPTHKSTRAVGCFIPRIKANTVLHGTNEVEK